MNREGGQPTVRIIEVLPREGLQQVLKHEELHVLTTDEKVDLIEALVGTGLREIEVTNYAHPKVIPGLADADELVRRLGRRPDAAFRAVVPNEKGMQRAIDSSCQKVVVLMNGSETYARMNSRMSIEENFVQARRIWEMGQQAGVEVAVGMAICFVCPYEGLVPERRIVDLVGRFVDLGCREITVSDSVGLATPDHVYRLCAQIHQTWPDLGLGLHLHDLAGFALANVAAAYRAGVRIFESALCGFGGGIVMPIDVRLMGNVPTEDVVYLFERMGVATGIDLAKLVRVGRLAEKLFCQDAGSRLLRTGLLEGALPIGALIE